MLPACTHVGCHRQACAYFTGFLQSGKVRENREGNGKVREF